jgi:hypothetical protein
MTGSQYVSDGRHRFGSRTPRLKGALASLLYSVTKALFGRTYAHSEIPGWIFPGITPRSLEINIVCRFVHMGKSNLEAMTPNGTARLMPAGT